VGCGHKQQQTGKWEWATSVDGRRVALIVNSMPRLPVPTWSREPSRDHDYTSPKVPAMCTNTEHDIVDLYSVTQPNVNTSEGTWEVPFVHEVHLYRPKGEAVRVCAVFDNGAMICAMSIDIFKQVNHRLADWLPSTCILCMANGALVLSQAMWTGTFEIEGVKAHRTFEVFDSGGGWSFLFRKPML
jgi:hypothetical protein